MDEITLAEFDVFLAMLDADRDEAGAGYERLRARLAKFFEWRGRANAEELADTVLNRVIKKVAHGEDIRNVGAYSARVAQFVLMEQNRTSEPFVLSIDDHPELEDRADHKNPDEPDARMDCLEKCLGNFAAEDRKTIVAYYDTDERTMITARKRLAESLGISLNILRIRVCRLKAKLEDCTRGCCLKAGVLKYF